MNLRQRISVIAASLLPALALCAYFALAPAKASADSCPPGTIYSPCSGHPGECGNGAGECFANGSKNGLYMFCYHCSQGGISNGHCTDPLAVCIPGGPGSCNDGCVTCSLTQCTP